MIGHLPSVTVGPPALSGRKALSEHREAATCGQRVRTLDGIDDQRRTGEAFNGVEAAVEPGRGRSAARAPGPAVAGRRWAHHHLPAAVCHPVHSAPAEARVTRAVGLVVAHVSPTVCSRGDALAALSDEQRSGRRH